MRITHEYFGKKACLIMLAAVASLLKMSLAADAGGFVDVVPFGELKRWDSDGKDYGVFWEDARDIFKVIVTFADSTASRKRVAQSMPMTCLCWCCASR